MSVFLLLFVCVSGLHVGFQILFYFRKNWLQIEGIIDLPAVSVIICAKNEAENLQLFLPSILNQEYAGEWELIVVNDASQDDTVEILNSFATQFDHLRLVHISMDRQRELPGKKMALQHGFEAAKYPYLLCTDADCKPAGKYWLAAMVTTAAARHKEIILGYGGYQQRRGILNQFIRWETVHTCMQYCSLSEIGKTYMGVGRNLLFQKTAIDRLKNNETFQSIYRNTPSGDDDITVSFAAANNNTGICLHPDAHTVSIPKDSWKAWWNQKKRHVSTGKYYPVVVKKLIGLYALNHALSWLLFIVAVILVSIGELRFPQLLWITACFLLRLGWSWINAGIWYRALKEKKLFWFYPIGDLGWAFYNVILSPYIFWKNRKSWK